jgi:hypothetical protein
MSEDDYWSASSGVFHWVVDFLADNVTDQDAVDRLRATSKKGFRWVYFSDFSESQVREMLRVLRESLLPAVERQFPRPQGDVTLAFTRKLVRDAKRWSRVS